MVGVQNSPWEIICLENSELMYYCCSALGVATQKTGPLVTAWLFSLEAVKILALWLVRATGLRVPTSLVPPMPRRTCEVSGRETPGWERLQGREASRMRQRSGTGERPGGGLASGQEVRGQNGPCEGASFSQSFGLLTRGSPPGGEAQEGRGSHDWQTCCRPSDSRERRFLWPLPLWPACHMTPASWWPDQLLLVLAGLHPALRQSWPLIITNLYPL